MSGGNDVGFVDVVGRWSIYRKCRLLKENFNEGADLKFTKRFGSKNRQVHLQVKVRVCMLDSRLHSKIALAAVLKIDSDVGTLRVCTANLYILIVHL